MIIILKYMSSPIKIKTYSSVQSGTMPSSKSSVSLEKHIKSLKQKILNLIPKIPQSPNPQQQGAMKKGISKRNRAYITDLINQKNNKKLNQHLISKNRNKNNTGSLDNALSQFKTQKNLYYKKYQHKKNFLPDIKSTPPYSHRPSVSCQQQNEIDAIQKVNQIIVCGDPSCIYKNKYEKTKKTENLRIQTDPSVPPEQIQKDHGLYYSKKHSKNYCFCKKIHQQKKTFPKDESNLISPLQLYKQFNIKSQLDRINSMKKPKQNSKNNSIVTVKAIKFSQKVTPRDLKINQFHKKDFVKIQRKKTKRNYLSSGLSPYQNYANGNILHQITHKNQTQKNNLQAQRQLSNLDLHGWTGSNYNRDIQKQEQEENQLIYKVETERNLRKSKEKQSTEQIQEEIAIQSQTEPEWIMMDTKIRFLEKTILS